MDAEDELLIKLGLIGAVAALGKLLAGDEALSVRKVVGRVLVGAIMSISALATLIHLTDLSESALTGISAIIGISGQSLVEYLAMKYLGYNKDECNHKKEDDDDKKDIK